MSEHEETLIVSHLIRYADHHPEFKRDFVDKIYEFLEEHEFITEKQFEIMKDIYQKNNVKLFMDELYGYQEEDW